VLSASEHVGHDSVALWMSEDLQSASTELVSALAAYPLRRYAAVRECGVGQ
jgi:hypothetical protein